MTRPIRHPTLALTLLAGGAALGPAQAPPQVSFRIVQTDPASRTTLGGGRPFYLRIEYTSDIPVRFQAEGLRAGEVVEQGASYNPAPAYPAGGGEAIAWLAFRGDTAIDAIRVTAYDERWNEVASERLARDARWSGASRGARQTAAWAQKLSDEQQQMTSAAMEAASDTGAGGDLIVTLMGASIPAYLLLQAFLLLRLRGGWRKAAMLPLAGMIPLALFTIAGAIAGAGLWPLMMLFLTPVAVGYLVVLWVAWFVAARTDARAVAGSP